MCIKYTKIAHLVAGAPGAPFRWHFRSWRRAMPLPRGCARAFPPSCLSPRASVEPAQESARAMSEHRAPARCVKGSPHKAPKEQARLGTPHAGFPRSLDTVPKP